jgi:glycogen operon protein
MSDSPQKKYVTRPGRRYPVGATPGPEGVNFSIFGRHATRVELLLYSQGDCPKPFQVIALDPEENRTFLVWHVFVVGLPVGTHYTWRVDGHANTALDGRRFDARRELCDPWAQAVSDIAWDRKGACAKDSNAWPALRAIVTEAASHAAPRTEPQRHPSLEGAVLYELHVGGFTRHPSAGVKHPGTFAGVIEKIPYLQELGITHVELLPVMAFDEQDVPFGAVARGLRNYWGYSTHSFYSAHPGYCRNPADAPREFLEMVDALHAANIQVILDVVFNHTAEGGADGPVINFKGLSNEVFYHLDPLDRRRYLDFTGCGNTVQCNHPQVTAFIVHCLEHWVERFGVDGFRFDLASVFVRGDCGIPLSDPPLPWNLELSRIVGGLPRIAEAWDAAGLYQVGSFPGLSWAEWNGRYRDCMRRFVRGDGGVIGEVASRLGGSSDLYAGDDRYPSNSINFITCHDGFTLYDLVSYNGKHNEANGEDNRDGSNDNLSWNCGVEGPTADPEVLRTRRRQARNFLALLMLSRGVPMLLAGDEVLRSQGGNNNAYCQDNELSWLDWSLVEANREMLRFARELIALRRRHPSLMRSRFFTGKRLPDRGIPDVAWHGPGLEEPDWQNGYVRFLGCTIAGLTRDEEDLCLLFNMSENEIRAALPSIPGRRWHLALDTSATPPGDIAAQASQQPFAPPSYRVGPRSVVVLEAR